MPAGDIPGFVQGHHNAGWDFVTLLWLTGLLWLRGGPKQGPYSGDGWGAPWAWPKVGVPRSEGAQEGAHHGDPWSIASAQLSKLPACLVSCVLVTIACPLGLTLAKEAFPWFG